MCIRDRAWTWLANTINHPLEKHIADGYVKDARARLQAMPNLIVVGITGSYGKTSAKNFLHDLLAVEYNVLMTPESYNTTMGVVRTIRERLRPSHQAVSYTHLDVYKRQGFPGIPSPSARPTRCPRSFPCIPGNRW